MALLAPFLLSSIPASYFCSSRGPHTRCGRDWSSDVCSSDLSAEYDHRQADPGVLAPPALLCVYGLHRHKDLRKPDDDFGFRSEERRVGKECRVKRLRRQYNKQDGIGIVENLNGYLASICRLA